MQFNKKSKFVHLHKEYPVTLDFHLDITDHENGTSQQLTMKGIFLNTGTAEMWHNVQGTKKLAFFDQKVALLSLQFMDFLHHLISKP